MAESPTPELDLKQADFGWQIPEESSKEVKLPSKFKLLTLQIPDGLESESEYFQDCERMGLIFSGFNILRAIAQKNQNFNVNSEMVDGIIQNGINSSEIFQDSDNLDGVIRTVNALRNMSSFEDPMLGGDRFVMKLETLRRCLPPEQRALFAKQLEGLKIEVPNLDPNEPPSKVFKINKRTRKRLVSQSYEHVKQRLEALTQEYVYPIQASQSGLDLLNYQGFDPAALQDLFDNLKVPIHDLANLIISISGMVQITQRHLGRVEVGKDELIRERFGPFGERFNAVSSFLADDVDPLIRESSHVKNEVNLNAMVDQINSEAVPFFIKNDIDYSVDHLALDKEINIESAIAKCSLPEFRRLSREVMNNIKDAFADKDAKGLEVPKLDENEEPEEPSPKEVVMVAWFDGENKQLVWDFLANCKPYPEEFVGGKFKSGRSIRTVQGDSQHSGLGMAYHQQILRDLGGEIDAQNPLIRGEVYSLTRIRFPMVSFQHHLPI